MKKFSVFSLVCCVFLLVGLTLNPAQAAKGDKVVEIEIAADKEPPADNPGQPFEQLEAKLDAFLPRIMKKLEIMEQKIDRLEKKADLQDLAIKELHHKVDKLEGKADAGGIAVGKLHDKVDILEAKADRLEAKGDRAGESMASLHAKADRLESKADRLEVKADENLGILNGMSIAIDAIKKVVDAILDIIPF